MYCSTFQSTVWKKMAGHVITMPCEPRRANRHVESQTFFAKFAPIPRTFYMLGFTFLELLCIFYERSELGFSYAKNYG